MGKVTRYYPGMLGSVWYGSGLATNYPSYDMYMRPLAIDHPGTAYDLSYGYDRQGNVTAWNGVSYAYDGMDRLVTGGYSYDAIGNQSVAPGGVSYTYVALSGSLGGYTIPTSPRSGMGLDSGSEETGAEPTTGNPSMRLLTKVVGGVTTDYTDDGNLANLVAVGGKYGSLTYDATNRLLSINDLARGVTDEYRYGPEGKRYRKEEGNKTTYYLYEGNDILYEEGYEGSSRSFCKLNVYVGGVNVGRVKVEGGTESVQYFYEDQLGSRRVVTDGSGNVQARIDYSEWGVPTVTNYGGYEGSSDVSYTGKERDATGLYYFNARYYDASLGRFITEDPVRNGMNWFVYCGNNPLSKTDQMGLAEIYVDDIYGKPVVAYKGRDLKAETSIVIKRDPGTSTFEIARGEKQYYRDIEQITIGNQVIFETSVQSMPTRNDPNDPHSGPLSVGEYVATILPKNQAKNYSDALSISGNGIDINWGYLNHSNVITNPASKIYGKVFDPPDSTGCPVIEGEDTIKTIVESLRSVGYSDWESLRLEIRMK